MLAWEPAAALEKKPLEGGRVHTSVEGKAGVFKIKTSDLLNDDYISM